MITASDLPYTPGGRIIIDTDNFAGWQVSRRSDGSFYAVCEVYDIIAQNALEMVAKLNELGAVIVGWE